MASVYTILVRIRAPFHHGLESYEREKIVEQFLFEIIVLLVKVLVPVSGHATEHVEVFRAYSFNKIGDEVGEYVWDPTRELGVDEPDSGDSDEAQAGAQPENPGHGDLAVHLKLVPLDRAVVPHESGCNHERDPPALVNFKKHGREVSALDQKGEEGEEKDEEPVAVPHE
ncbi:redox-sensing transcriptional repressor Rex [Striga asiatica]|uniref:Redox-sensing transcriptional repressor Rex n=1 Tax=Striga asiatica TaxID=4170 RepID=A0A5A7Q6X5_STRAF|nr:redox-sensing transcriptional repressor Rex [Striga asiatica]